MLNENNRNLLIGFLLKPDRLRDFPLGPCTVVVRFCCFLKIWCRIYECLGSWTYTISKNMVWTCGSRYIHYTLFCCQASPSHSSVFCQCHVDARWAIFTPVLLINTVFPCHYVHTGFGTQTVQWNLSVLNSHKSECHIESTDTYSSHFIHIIAYTSSVGNFLCNQQSMVQSNISIVLKV